MEEAIRSTAFQIAACDAAAPAIDLLESPRGTT